MATPTEQAIEGGDKLHDLAWQYAGKLQEIYDNNAVGDYTFYGLLVEYSTKLIPIFEATKEQMR